MKIEFPEDMKARATTMTKQGLALLEMLGGPPAPRAPLLDFMAAMEKKLRLNDFKGGRAEWKKCDILIMIDRVQEELDEFAKAVLADKPKEEVLAEAADVANMSMMVADIYGCFGDQSAQEEKATT